MDRFGPDKRRTWREQEQRLVERWNAAALRYQEVQAEVTASAEVSAELRQREQAARDEIDAVRRAVARLKVEFNAGRRY